MNSDKLKVAMPYASVSCCGLGGITLFIFALVNRHAPVKTMLMISAILLLVDAALVYVYMFVLAEKQKNFFLTDRDTGKTIGLGRLTFESVNDSMNYFMVNRIENADEPWVGGMLARRGIFGNNDLFKPLVVYKMFYDLSVSDRYENWQLFFKMPNADFARLLNCLESVGDLNMLRKLTSIRRINDGTEVERLADCIKGNTRYIENQMMEYITNNIELFNEEKDGN